MSSFKPIHNPKPVTYNSIQSSLNKVGEFFKKAREKKKLTKNAVGLQSQTNWARVRSIENADSRYTFKAFLQVVNALGITVILEGEDGEQKKIN